MTTLLTVAGMAIIPVVALAIAVRAIRKPDYDEHFDNPDHWGAV